MLVAIVVVAYCGFKYRFRLNKTRFLLIRNSPVISKGFFIYFCPNRQIIVGFVIKLSDSVLETTESLNKSKGAVNTHRNAPSDGIWRMLDIVYQGPLGPL
jgi:hypothetical protein